MGYSFRQRKSDNGFDFYSPDGKKTNIETYVKNTGANINQLRQKLATQGDTQSQRIVAGLPTQFRAPTQQQSTPSVFNTPIVRTPTVSQAVSQPTIQAPKVYTPKAQQAYTDAKIIGTGRPDEVRQAITRTVDRKNSVKLDPQFKQGKSYEDIARDAGFSIDEVKRYAERNHKGYGDLGLIGNAARAIGQFVGTTVDNGVGIVRKPISTLALIDRNNQQKINDDLSQINKDLYYRNITPKAAQERASALTKDLIGMKATQDQKTGMYRLGDMNTAEFTGQFAQQGIDSASLLPVAGGAASGSARIASALGNKTAANTLNKAASVMTAGAQTQATSKLANALTARGMNPQTANLIGNAVTSNAKQSLVYGTAQTSADVASGRGITPESLAMNYGADFLMGAVPEIGLGSIGRGIDLNNAKVHQELVRTNPTYKANTDKLTGVDATIARAQANGDVRALEGLQAVKAQLSDSNALIARRYSENGFLGGKNATGFKDAEARGEVFTDTPDGMPRFEVDDSGAKLNLQGVQKSNKLGDILQHPQLFEQYPELKSVPVELTANSYSSFDGKKIKLGTNARNNPGTLLHEIQHAIQRKEGFASGGSPDTALPKAETDKLVQEARRWKELGVDSEADRIVKELSDKSANAYQRLAGEAEARAVQARMDMPMSERYVNGKNTFYNSLDVPKKDLIVKNSSTEANYITKGRTPSKIHPEDQTVMAKLIDYARGYGQKLSDNAAHELQIDAARIAERYGIEVKWTESRKPLSSLADAFDRRLSGQKYEGVAMSIDEGKIDPTAALKQEALKYKTAEEFVEAQGEPAYHRSQSKFDKFDISKVSNASTRQNGGWGLYFSDAEPSSQAYGNYLYEVRVPKDTLLESGSPVSESVVSKIVDAVKRDNRNPNELNEFSHNGWLFYKTLGRILGSDKKASLFLARNGVDGLKMNRGSNFNDYILFDDKSIKTKQQLTDLYNQATQPQPPKAKPSPLESLKQEARKYKSADEFVKAQGEPVYHGTGSKFDKFDSQFQGQNYRQGEGGFHFTSKKSTAENYATLGAQSQGKASGYVIEAHLKLNKPLTVEAPSSIRAADFYDDHIGDIQLQAMQNGNDGIIVKGNGENLHIALSPDVIHTKQQLTDLYNQAHAQSQAPVAQPKVEAPQPKIEAPKQPTAFELDLKKAGLGVEPDAYRKQPKDVKKAIDAYIANENPQLAYALDSKLHFPDGIPKVRPEDVKAITGLTPREAGIPPIYVSRNARPIDKLAVEYETTVRGNTSGELKMTSEDFLDTMMDAIEANRSVGQQTKLIRELRNNPDVIAKARATLEAERAQYGTPEVVEPSKSDVAFLNRVDKQRIEQDVATHKAKLQEINKKIREEKPRNPVLPTYKTKQVGIIDKVFRSTRSIIERQGESGKKLAEALQDQRTNKELWIRQIEKQIPTVMKLKGKEFENFIDATQGDAKPLNDNVSKAIGEWRSTHPEVRQRGLDAGLNIGDLGETYYPHFIDYDKIYKDKNTYNEAINHLVTTKQAETPEAAIALLGRARDISRNREFGNLEASRIIDLPFYDRSKNTLASYINSSADRITKAEVFGKSDEKALALIKQIGLEGGDTEAAKNAFDVAVGAKQYNHTASKVSGGIRQYITTTRLGLGALTNVSQNVNTGVVTGHLRTMGAIFKQLDPKTRQWAADTGVISDAIIQDLRRGYGAETFGNKKLGKVVNAITAPGFATVEKFNRRVAATAGKDYALRLAQKGDAKSISTLRKLGVEGEINGTLTDAQQVQAARKIVEKTQFKVDAQDLPGWTDSPGGKLVSQFRTFSYSQAKFFSNEVLKPAAKGNLMPLARVLAALPVGYALYETRRMIDGRPEEDDKSKVALSSFQKIGGAGLALDIYLGMNPVGSKYLPSDRRVSMAVGTLGGPSAGIAADAVGSLSEAVQRKNTPEDESRLEGKIAVANNGEDYTDLTALSRFGLRQIPIVGTPIVNRAIPYKKQSDADAGKSTTGNAGLDELTKAKEKRSADLKNAFSKEDWKLYNLSKADRQKLVSNGTYSQEKIDGLMKYGKAKEAELGYGATSTDITAKTPASAKSILETYDTLDTEARKKWSAKKNTNAAVTKSLQAWLGDKVKIPEVTNDVAKEWADFQNDYADGKISKLKENDQKKAILKKAFNSQLSTDEKEIHTLTKTELQYYYDNGVITDENINKAIAVEKQLFDAGLIAKETLQRNLGSSARGYKTSSGSSGRKTSTKTASKASIAELLASQKQINDINNSTYLSLSKLLGSVTSGSSKMAKNKIGREVTLKKITGAKA